MKKIVILSSSPRMRATDFSSLQLPRKSCRNSSLSSIPSHRWKRCCLIFFPNGRNRMKNRRDKTKKLVTVIRVMYSGRDVDKQLDEFTKL